MSGFKDLLDTIFPDPPHRGVDTSIAAAVSMRPHVTQLAQHVEQFIRARGDHGATYSEVMSSLGLGAPTVSARLCELVKAEKIKASEQRRPTPSGRMARVYVVKQRSES